MPSLLAAASLVWPLMTTLSLAHHLRHRALYAPWIVLVRYKLADRHLYHVKQLERLQIICLAKMISSDDRM